MLKTSNKKYYKRIDIPDMKRCGLELEESEIAWKYQNNTVIISYDKPQQVIDMENKKKSELKNIGVGHGGGGNSDIRAMLGGPPPP